jgi:hypothetical protein
MHPINPSLQRVEVGGDVAASRSVNPVFGVASPGMTLAASATI